MPAWQLKAQPKVNVFIQEERPPVFAEEAPLLLFSRVMTALELLILIALIRTSAYMAASEVALFSLSRFQLRYFRERCRSEASHASSRLLADPGGLLVTILVVNEILNISISS